MANFAVALYEHKCFGCQQYTLGIAYFGLMELLQFFQHFWLAVPEDGYQMYVILFLFWGLFDYS